MLAQFIQDFIHLECGDDRFNQHSGLDRSLRQTEFILGHHEDIVPQTCFEVRFHFRQVEVRTCATRQLLFRVMDHEQRKVENTARNTLAINQHMFFIQMPAAWTHDQCCGLVVQLIGLAILFQCNCLSHCVDHVDLAGNLVVPVRRI